MLKKNILIYGATGSIGSSALNLIRNNREQFNVVGITCNSNIDKLLDIADEFECNNLGINNENIISNYSKLKNYIDGKTVKKKIFIPERLINIIV